MANQSNIKTFKYYPNFKFTEVTPYTVNLKIGNDSQYDVDKSKEYPNILSCKEELTGKSYLYFINHKRLYKIVENSWFGFTILLDVRVNKYNLMSMWNGQLRFNIYKQPNFYMASDFPHLHKFMYVKWHKIKKQIIERCYDGFKLYSFNTPLNEALTKT